MNNLEVPIHPANHHLQVAYSDRVRLECLKALLFSLQPEVNVGVRPTFSPFTVWRWLTPKPRLIQLGDGGAL